MPLKVMEAERAGITFCQAGKGGVQIHQSATESGPIPHGFHTKSRITSHNRASPTESSNAPMPMKSTIDAPTTLDGASFQTVRLGRGDGGSAGPVHPTPGQKPGIQWLSHAIWEAGSGRLFWQGGGGFHFTDFCFSVETLACRGHLWPGMNTGNPADFSTQAASNR